jgi:hypothetical protein
MISIATVTRVVAAEFDMPVNRLVADDRSGAAVRARHVAMLVARDMTSASTTVIGRAFGGRDHTTVLHALRSIPYRIARDPDLKAKVARVRASLEATPPLEQELGAALEPALAIDLAFAAFARAVADAARHFHAAARALSQLDDALASARQGGRPQ